MPSRVSFWALAGVVALAGCTAPVEPPKLSRRVPLPIEKIALGPELDRAAVLRIVDALGESSSDPSEAKALRDAVETFFAPELSGFRDELSRAALDEADDREGLLALVESRVADGTTAETIASWRRRLSKAPWKPLADAFLDLAEKDDTAPLAEKAAVLLDPRWTDALPSFATRKDDRLPELFGEIAGKLADTGTREKLAAALQRTLGGTAAPALFDAASAAFAEDDREPYVFAKALERSLKEKFEAEGAPAVSGLEGLLRLFETLDRSSEGLFEAMENAFADDPALRNLAAQLVRVEIVDTLGRTATRALVEDLGAEAALRIATEEDLDGAGFQELYGRVLDGFQQLLGPIPADSDALYAASVVARIPPCLAVARWLQAGIRAAAADLKAIPDDEFRDRFLTRKWTFAAKTVVLGKTVEKKVVLDDSVEAVLGEKKLNVVAALPVLRAAVATNVVPRSIAFPETKNATLETVLRAAVRSVDAARPLADALPTMRTLLDGLARSPKGWLASFDGPNVWNGLHGALRALPAEQLPRARTLLFETLRLQTLSPNARNLLGQLVEKAPKAGALLTAGLRDLGAFAAFAAPAPDRDDRLGEPLAFYRRLLASLPETAIDVPGRWFRVAKALGLGTAAATKALPASHAWLGTPDRLVRAARWVAEFPSEGRFEALAPVVALFPAKLEKAWVEAFRRLAAVAGPLRDATAELVDGDGQFHGLVPASEGERAWLSRKARAGAWGRGGAPALRWLRKGGADGLVPTFRRWAEDGTWARLFDHLQWVKDARLARWARALRRAEASGVLRALFCQGKPRKSPLPRSTRP